MKRIISVIICAVIILTLTGCDSGDYKKAVEFFESGEYQQALEIFSDLEGYKDTDTYIEKINTKIKEEKYNDAISYIKSKDYVKAIELLEEIPDYKDSKSLVGKVHYVYGSQLFNERDFSGAYQHFQEASGYSDIAERKSMVDYYGGINFTNNGQYSSACTYFKRAIDSDYVQDAVKHVSELTKNLLSGGWIGSCVVNGNTFQVQMSYSKSSNNFSLVWADRSNGGYKHVTDMDYGTLSVVGSRNAFYYEGNFYTVEFDFYSSTSVRAKWSDSKLDGMAGGMFKRDYAAVFEYKIPDVVYPIMTIPDLFSNNSSNVVDSSSQAEPEVSSINTTSTTSQTNNSNNKSPSNLKSGKSNNSSNTTQKSKTNIASSKQHFHDFTINATCDQPAKCVCGETFGTANGHLWEEATCTTPKKCKVCNKTEGQALGHSFNNNAPFYCSTCEEENPNALSILNKINVETVDSKVSINNFSFSEFRLMGISTPFGKQGYSFTMDYEIECLSDFGTYQMNIVAYNADNSILSESYVMYNHYGGTLTAGEKEKSSKTFIIYSDSPVTKIEIG